MTPQKYFPDIAAAAWEHAADREAFAAFTSLPLSTGIVGRFLGLASDRSFRLIALANGLRVSETQFTGLHHSVREVCDILDVRFEPEVFIEFSPVTRAYAVGFDKPFIVLTSSVLDLFDEAEIVGLLGRELGHCMSGRAAYKTLLWFIQSVSPHLCEGLTPIDRDAMIALAALREWDRRSELSADRAALLVTQDVLVVLRMLMKQIAGLRYPDCNVHELIRQAEEFELGSAHVDSAAMILSAVDGMRNFPVSRIAEIRRWERSGRYREILNGDYPRRSASPAEQDVSADSIKAMMDSINEGALRVDSFFKTLLRG
ncbi:MAG: M48 family metallopeptidase [Spirochaetes bacterium]|nr:M48 family metallopeptidase [Spirochaetota bacterium]